jgi:1-acyl-sn-glycerol-3-phosphate acyltransferase
MGDKKISKEEILSAFPHNAGDSGFDPWGFNIKGVADTLGFAKFLHDTFFRVEAFGLENIPKEGRALIIANHSGQLPLDGMLLGYSLLTNPHGPRAAKAMIERFLPKVPFVGNYLNSLGAVIGDPENCKRMLQKDEAIVVFPEGVRGSNKVFRKRYKLQRFGHGFMYLAMENQTPIIPVGIVGCEESIISFGEIKSLAKIFGLPVFPLAFPMIFPTKVYIHYGEPMWFSGNDMHEEKVRENVEKVRKEIKKLLDLGLAKRKSIFT